MMVRLHRCLLIVSGAAAGATILSMTLLITVDVLGRYLFGMPTQIAVEMSGYMLVAMIFLGLAYTDSCERHITITVFTDRLSPGTRRRFAFVNAAVATLFSGWLAWFTLQPVLQDYALGTVSLTGTRTPTWIPGLFIPVGFAVLAVHLAAKLGAMIAAARRVRP